MWCTASVGLTSPTLYVSMPHVFAVLGDGVLKVLSVFELNESLSARTAFFREGETHAIHLAHDITV